MKKNVFQNILLIEYFKFILVDIENLEVPQHEPHNNNCSIPIKNITTT